MSDQPASQNVSAETDRLHVARCNRCNKSFITALDPQDLPRFDGQGARRLAVWSTCPLCGMTDLHWIYATDYVMFDLAAEGKNEAGIDQWRWSLLDAFTRQPVKTGLALSVNSARDKYRKALQEWIEEN